MIFIRPISIEELNTNWGKCDACSKLPPIGTLCQECLEKRKAHANKIHEQRISCLEYRIRAWLSDFFNPEKSKRYRYVLGR